MADPLLVLRECVIQSKPFVVAGDSVILGDLQCPRDSLTNYKSKRGAGEYYTLYAICFLLQKKELSYTDYLQECRKANIPSVSLVDRKDLLSLLTGETETSPYFAPGVNQVAWVHSGLSIRYIDRWTSAIL